MSDKRSVIESILDLELNMFLNVRSEVRSAARKTPKRSVCTAGPNSPYGQRRPCAATITTWLTRKSKDATDDAQIRPHGEPHSSSE